MTSAQEIIAEVEEVISDMPPAEQREFLDEIISSLSSTRLELGEEAEEEEY